MGLGTSALLTDPPAPAAEAQPEDPLRLLSGALPWSPEAPWEGRHSPNPPPCDLWQEPSSHPHPILKGQKDVCLSSLCHPPSRPRYRRLRTPPRRQACLRFLADSSSSAAPSWGILAEEYRSRRRDWAQQNPSRRGTGTPEDCRSRRRSRLISESLQPVMAEMGWACRKAGVGAHGFSLERRQAAEDRRAWRVGVQASRARAI